MKRKQGGEKERGKWESGKERKKEGKGTKGGNLTLQKNK
jgi:hypothetical protein